MSTTRDRHPRRRYRPVRRDGPPLDPPVPGRPAVRTPNGVTFVLPARVYDELTVDAPDGETPPVDSAIEAGWADVAAPLAYTNALVSRTMDGVQRYIANADDRPADEIERADPALAAVAVRAFAEREADHAYIYTTDVLAGMGAETVLARKGYGDSVTYVNGFRFVDDLLD